MEYFRDPKNQIYADLAYRLGKIVTQYEALNLKEEKFESTLYIAVLQNLLTSCSELLKNMSKDIRTSSIFNTSIEEGVWGLNESCWIKNTFKEEPTLKNFIARIRNSVSHPTITDVKSQFPSTGYSTIKDGSGLINKYRFVNSPNIINNKQQPISLKHIQLIFNEDGSLKNSRIRKEYPKGISYQPVENENNKYELVLNGKPFVRLSIIDLSTEQLSSFVKELANYLAQPIQSNWDGKTIRNLLVA